MNTDKYNFKLYFKCQTVNFLTNEILSTANHKERKAIDNVRVSWNKRLFSALFSLMLTRQLTQSKTGHKRKHEPECYNVGLRLDLAGHLVIFIKIEQASNYLYFYT